MNLGDCRMQSFSCPFHLKVLAAGLCLYPRVHFWSKCGISLEEHLPGTFHWLPSAVHQTEVNESKPGCCENPHLGCGLQMPKNPQALVFNNSSGYVGLTMLRRILSLMFDFLSTPFESSILGPVVCAKHAEAVKHTGSFSRGGEAWCFSKRISLWSFSHQELPGMLYQHFQTIFSLFFLFFYVLVACEWNLRLYLGSYTHFEILLRRVYNRLFTNYVHFTAYFTNNIITLYITYT